MCVCCMIYFVAFAPNLVSIDLCIKSLIIIDQTLVILAMIRIKHLLLSIVELQNQIQTVFFFLNSPQLSLPSTTMSAPSTLDGSIISDLSNFSGTPPSDITTKFVPSHHRPSVSLNILDFEYVEIDTQ